MSFRGIEFTQEMRKLVVNVKQFFSDNKKNPEIFTTNCPYRLAAFALGIGESNVRKIIPMFNKGGEDLLASSNSENRGRPRYSIEGGVETSVRQFIRASNKNGKQTTLEVIKSFLKESLNCDVTATTLWRTLQRWGFEFGKGIRSAHLKESERIIILRRQYLRQKIKNRNSDGSAIRPEIYLDESFINKNHSRDASWFFEDDNILSKPTGKGERLIIVNAVDANGWVPNAKYVFKAKKKTNDYHSSMNWNVFSEWFENKLLPNIPAESIIIFDNASYHNVLSDEAFPQKKHTFMHLRYWLLNNHIHYTDDMLKEELFQLCAKNCPKPEFALDKISLKHGHSILRTPPYHPELQPIEICWAVVKSYVAKHNKFDMDILMNLLEEGFNKVGSNTMKSILKKVQTYEDDFWAEDSRIANENAETGFLDLEELEEEI